MPKRVTENADAPLAEIAAMAREFAHAFVRELRAQLNGNTAPAIGETPTEKKARLAKERTFELYKTFNVLPDDAYVSKEVVMLLEGGVSRATVARRINAGLLPQPERRGPPALFRVGAVRAARAASAAEPKSDRARTDRYARKPGHGATDTA